MSPAPFRRRDVLRSTSLVAASGLAGCLFGYPTTDRLCGDRRAEQFEDTVADATGQSLGDQPAGVDWPLERLDPGRTAVTDAPGPRENVARFWRYEPDTDYGSPTWIALGAGLLFVAALDGDSLVALDPATGTAEWTYDGLGGVGRPAVFGLADDRTVVVGGGNGLHAVDPATGQRRWHVPGDTYDHDLTLTGRDGVVYADGRRRLRAVDLASGEEVWTVEGVSHTGAVTADAVLVGGDGLVAYDTTDGSQRWERSDVTPYGSTAVVGDTVYAGELGRVHALDVADGATNWSSRGETEDFETPTVTDDAVFAGSTMTEAGGGNLYRLDRASGDPDWCFSLDERDVAATAVADGTLLLAASDLVQARDAVDGSVRWTHRQQNEWYTGLAVAGSALYATTESGAVEAFGER